MTEEERTELCRVTEANTQRVLGVLREDGLGWRGEMDPSIFFGRFGETQFYREMPWSDAMAEFAQHISSMGFRLEHPSSMFRYSLVKDSNGFFLALPGDAEHQGGGGNTVMCDHISWYEAGPLGNRLNKVRSFFGPRVNEATMEQMWQLEARMKEIDTPA